MSTIFSLEKWDTSHIEGLARHADNRHIADNLRDPFPSPYTLGDAEWYVNDCIRREHDKDRICRAIVINRQAAGSIGIYLNDGFRKHSAELGYWLGEEYWGQGIMTEAVRIICRKAFLTMPVTNIYSEVFEHNTGSRRVLEKAGFSFECILKNSAFKRGERIDTMLYTLYATDKK